MSKGINKVILVGNVGKEPEIRAAGNSTVANFSIATSESWKDKQTGDMHERTEWHNCVAWGKTAETIGKYVNKGSQLYVEGKLQTRSWEKDGVKRYSTEVIVDQFQFCGGKGQKQPQPQQPAAPEPTQPDFDDDIPF